MRKTILLFLILLTGLALQACSPKEVGAAEAQAPEIQEATPEMPSLPSPDLVVESQRAQKDGFVIVNLGEIVAITPPANPAEWRISFAESVLEILTPKELLGNPGSQGWLFRAWAVGSTDIRLTSVTPACTDPLPCPQAPPQVITFTLEVK